MRKFFPLSPMARAARLALDSLLPPRCLSCGEVMESTGNLCPDCWGKVDFITPPQCDSCGRPFDFAVGEETLCGVCARGKPSYGRARAVFRYDDFSRGLVLAFKYADRSDIAPAFGRWLARSGGALLSGADYLIPVPLHWRRLFMRRYNQAALLAHAVGDETGLPVLPDLLRRVRPTPPLGRLSAAQRHARLAGAIALSPAYTDSGPKGGFLQARRIVLIDDVMTSGATAGECVKILYAAGAENVDVLTLARVDLEFSG